MNENTSDYLEGVTGDDPDLMTAPIPVEVANEVRVQERPARSMNTGQVPVGTRPTQIVGSLRSRVSILLTVRGDVSATVWVGSHAGISDTVGYQLDPDASLALEMSGDVWAIASATGSAIHWLSQNRDG